MPSKKTAPPSGQIHFSVKKKKTGGQLHIIYNEDTNSVTVAVLHTLKQKALSVTVARREWDRILREIAAR